MCSSEARKTSLVQEIYLSRCPSAFGLWLLSISVISPVFMDVIPLNLVRRYEHFIRTCLLSFSTLKKEAANTYEMLVSVYQTTQFHVLQDHNL